MHVAVGAEVEANGIDLVVAAPANLHQGGPDSRGRGLTHSDWQVVTSCPVPLLLVNGGGRAKYGHIVVAVDPFHAHAKPAELDRDLLREAKALQVLTGARLSVLHCYAPVDYFGADLTLLPARDPRFVDARVEAVRALCSEAGIDPAAARLVVGMPHNVLRTMQQRREADVIVMGALARGRVAEFIVGNTAERVLHDAIADVLLVAPRGSATNR
jgi:universal stress protein E